MASWLILVAAACVAAERARETDLRRALERPYEMKLGEQQTEPRAGRAEALRDDLDRLRTRLARLAAAPEAPGSPVQAALLALLDAPPDGPTEEQDAGDTDGDQW